MIVKNIFIQLIEWIGKSFSGPNGVPSSMRLLAFSIFFLCYAFGRTMFTINIFMNINSTETDEIIKSLWLCLYGCALDCVFILLLYGILKPSDIASIRSGILTKGTETVKTETVTKQEKITNKTTDVGNGEQGDTKVADGI